MLRIRIPSHTKEKSNADNRYGPFFEVEKMAVTRADGVVLDQIALVNGSTKETLGLVSNNYRVTTHKEASDWVRETLDALGLQVESVEVSTASKGARFFETLQFPGLRFNPASGLASTALDNVGLTKDDIIPTITVKNSYDRSSPICWNYGAYRVVCQNGMAVLMHETKISVRHNSSSFQLDNVKRMIHDNLDLTVKAISDAYIKLNGESGQTGMEALLASHHLSDKFKFQFLSKIGRHAEIDASIESGKEDKNRFQVINSIKTGLSAYAVYNISTEIASHDILSVQDRESHNRRIAEIFQIAA